jgi:hypothetical protein
VFPVAGRSNAQRSLFEDVCDLRRAICSESKGCAGRTVSWCQAANWHRTLLLPASSGVQQGCQSSHRTREFLVQPRHLFPRITLERRQAPRHVPDGVVIRADPRRQFSPGERRRNRGTRPCARRVSGNGCRASGVPQVTDKNLAGTRHVGRVMPGIRNDDGVRPLLAESIVTWQCKELPAW